MSNLYLIILSVLKYISLSHALHTILRKYSTEKKQQQHAIKACAQYTMTVFEHEWDTLSRKLTLGVTNQKVT